MKIIHLLCAGFACFFCTHLHAQATLKSAIEIKHINTEVSGGFSALWVSPNCDRLITISDYSEAQQKLESITRSGWYEALIEYNPQGDLIGVKSLQSGQVIGRDGKVVHSGIEGMAWDGAGFLISFDDRPDIYRYPGASPSGNVFSVAPDVFDHQGEDLAEKNAGLESLTVLAEGLIFALWEKDNKKGALPISWLIRLGEAPVERQYISDGAPKGATTLADGSILVLESEYLKKKGTRVRLVHISKEKLFMPDIPLQGQPLFDATSTDFDNFEGVSACRRNGRDYVFAISDNNGDWERALQGNNPQSTLLFMFDISW